MEAKVMKKGNRFTLGFYFQAVTGMLKEPRRFFSEMPENMGMKKPMIFLLVSGFLSAFAGIITGMPENPFLSGGIYFTNAIGMAFVAVGFGYVIMTMLIGRRAPFVKFFSVFAFSTGTTLLASWLPFFFWITEPWKWWLIGTGMTTGCGFSGRHTVLIICLTICMIVLFFWSVLPLLTLLGNKSP